MKSLKKIAALTLVAVCTFGNASVVTFNSAPDNNYFSGPVTSDGFTVAGTIHQGTFSDFDGRGQTNGTVYYGIWNNAGLTTSGFTLTAADNSLFSLMAFDFDNAYPGGGARTTSLTLTGTLADDSTVSTTFSNLGNILSWTTLNVGGGFVGLKSVAFSASGETSTRALFDNIVVNANAVPEPGSMALVGVALLGLGLGLTRKQK